MQFEEESKVAGSVGAALRDEDVRRVMSAFGDGCLARYHLDIREHRAYMAPSTMKSVKTFIKDLGPEDAVFVTKRFFEAPYGGFFKGKPLGPTFFSKRYRYLAMQIIAEG